MQSTTSNTTEGFILRLEDDPQRRGYPGPKPSNQTYLYLAEPETNEWAYRMSRACVFITIDLALEAARNSHAHAKIHRTEKLDLLDMEGQLVRPIKQEELHGGTKPKPIRPDPDEL